MSQPTSLHVVPFDTVHPRNEPEPLLLRTKEAAQILRISERKVQQMCKAGELEHVYFGRALRIARWSVLRYVPQPRETM